MGVRTPGTSSSQAHPVLAGTPSVLQFLLPSGRQEVICFGHCMTGALSGVSQVLGSHQGAVRPAPSQLCSAFPAGCFLVRAEGSLALGLIPAVLLG